MRCTRLLSRIIHSFIHLFIHSFRIFLYRLFKSSTTQRSSRHSTNTVPEFHAEETQAIVSEGLAQQGSYLAARAKVEPMILRTKGVDSTKAPPRPIISHDPLETLHCSHETVSLLVEVVFQTTAPSL